MMLFLIVGLLGLALLVLSLVTDGLLDALHFDLFDNGLFSTVSLTTFVALFGFCGFLSYSLGLLPALLIGFGAGLLGGLAIGGLVKLFKGVAQEEGTYSTQSLVGAVGHVIAPAQAGSYATVAIPWQGSNQYFSALSTDDLPKGQDVKVLELISHSAVKVTPYYR